MRGALITVALCLSAPTFAQSEQSGRVSVIERQEANGTYTLVHEVEVAAAPDAVWQAIATAEGWRTWAAPVVRMIDGEPDMIEASYDANAAPGDPSMIRQQFGDRVPGRRLSFRTVQAPQGFPHFETYREVVTTFELMPLAAGRTQVRLTATGYADNDAGRQLRAFFREGNRISLERLRQSFADGPIDWARAN